VSLTQSTELGTVYTPDELRAITRHAHSLGLTVYMDGSRLANAAASLGLPLRDFTTEVGVDVVTLGGTKNGILGGEAIIVLTPGASEGLTYLRKLNMQLASKMRFVSAQLIALLEDDLYLRNASHANAMAARLRSAVEGLPGIEFTHPTDANAVFAVLPEGSADRLRESFRFYDWDAAKREVRWMCAWDTTDGDIDAFVAAITTELS
jgi:threonine aldolase